MGRIIAIHRRPDGRAYPGPPPRDDRFVPVIDYIRANAMLGQLWLVPIRFTPNTDEATDIKRSLYNAARYYCSCPHPGCTRQYGNVPGQNKNNPDGGCPRGGQRIGCTATLVRVNGAVRVQFMFVDKKEAMREVIAKYGPDPSKWPYQAKAKRKR